MIEGQYQAEAARALAGRDASNLLSRGQQILGLHSASANRSQALGAIAGGYATSAQMAEAQRQATIGLLEQCRRQQVSGLLADRSFGQQQVNITMRRDAQVQCINSAYALNLDVNQLNFAGVMKAAELVRASGLKAVKFEQMSQIVTTLSRDMERRAESAPTMRY